MTAGPTDGGRRSERIPDGGDDERTGWIERLLIVTSIGVTFLLVAYVAWQATLTPATAEPTATVTGTERLSGGGIRVAVTLSNGQDVGLVMATIDVDCSTPPAELIFEHVPADGRRTGYVTCPSGTMSPEVSVSTWVEA